jgi:hypothetical protein
MKYRQCFTVYGTMQFPIDMLRYDHCFPASEQDSYTILDTFNKLQPHGRWKVGLMRYVETKGAYPTLGRWESFCAKVDQSSFRTEKI